MAWGAAGYRLVLAEAGSAAQVLELALAKALAGSHRIISRAGQPASASRPAAEAGLREPAPEVHLLQARRVLLHAACMLLCDMQECQTAASMLASL